MSAAFQGLTSIHRAGTMEEAVQLAAQVTPQGGTVLLSPGCSSFDMFKSYEERGRIFAVITSYSIHYTKLYEPLSTAPPAGSRPSSSPPALPPRCG